MTTGRINQVTISVCTETPPLGQIPVQHQYSRRKTLSTVGVHYKASTMPYVNSSTATTRIPFQKNVLSTAVTSRRNTLYPDLTSFRQALLVQRTKITAFSEDYQQPAAPEKMRTVTAYLQFVQLQSSLTNGKQSTPFPRAGNALHKSECLTSKQVKVLDYTLNTFPFQSSTSCLTSISMDQFKKYPPTSRDCTRRL